MSLLLNPAGRLIRLKLSNHKSHMIILSHLLLLAPLVAAVCKPLPPELIDTYFSSPKVSNSPFRVAKEVSVVQGLIIPLQIRENEVTQKIQPSFVQPILDEIKSIAYGLTQSELLLAPSDVVSKYESSSLQIIVETSSSRTKYVFNILIQTLTEPET